MTSSKSEGRYFSTQGSDSEPSFCFWRTLSFLCFTVDAQFGYLSSTSMVLNGKNCCETSIVFIDCVRENRNKQNT